MSQITVQCRLVATEETRQYLWHLMADIYTPFINEMIKQVQEASDFEQWCQTGKVPDDVFKNIREALKKEPKFKGMPGRWFYAGCNLVKRIYKSWLALRLRLRSQLAGQYRWLEILQSDDDLMEASGLDLPALRVESARILEGLNARLLKAAAKSNKKTRQRSSKKSRKAQNKNLRDALFDLYRETDSKDRVARCAIAYLLKNKCQVSEQSEDPEEFQHRRRRAEIRAERLIKELTRTRLPKGRDLTNEQWLEALAIATSQVPQDETEAAIWQSRLLTNAATLPFPVAYETNEDLRWFLNGKGRLCVSFNGLGKRTFEIYCDQRQLHWFKRFLEDRQIKKDSKGERTAGLFTLRTGRISWTEHLSGGNPWSSNRLVLQCSADSRLWTAEGTEQIRQEKAISTAKSIAGSKAKGDLDQEQQDSITKRETTLKLLQNPFPRPSKPLYQGNPSIIAAISFGLEKPATLAIVNVTTGKAIAYRSIRQLLGKNYQLLTKHRLQQQQRAHQRHKKQIKGADKTFSEGGLGEYIDSLIAKAVVDTAVEFSASSIALPDLGNVREIVQAEVQAKAERKIPGLKEKQAEYAAQYRRKVHRWSYGRLTEKIATKASLAGIETESTRQFLQGTPQEKAHSLAILAYRSRTINSIPRA